MIRTPLTLPQESADKYADFIAKAKAAREKTLKTGLGYDADEVHAYLRQRVKAVQADGADTASFP